MVVCPAAGERRAKRAAQRVRSPNQLHALCGRPDCGWCTDGAQGQHSRERFSPEVRPKTSPEATRKALAWDLVPEIRSIDTRLGAVIAQMTEARQDYPTQLLEVDGIGPVLAVRLIGRCGRACRFPNADAFANYAGVAPIEVSSGERAVHRLSRSDDRQPELGSTSRRCHPGPHAQQRRAALLRPHDQRGQDPQAAMRCLKRKIASRVWRLMLADEHHRSSIARPQPKAA